jgi:hypothetical protein
MLRQMGRQASSLKHRSGNAVRRLQGKHLQPRNISQHYQVVPQAVLADRGALMNMIHAKQQ